MDIINQITESKKGSKIFVARSYNNIIDSALLMPHYNSKNQKQIIPFNFTENLEEASLILVPTEIFKWQKNASYIRYLKNLSSHKPLLIVNSADFYNKQPIKNAIYLRFFLNPGERPVNTLIAPYPIKPIFSARKIKPEYLVSFTGYIPKRFIKRIMYAFSLSAFHPIKSNGAIVRNLMLYKFRRSKLPLNMLIRGEYLGKYTAFDRFDQHKRHEYEKSIGMSRYVLCPRGDGNQSQRFYEVLSAGRIPILLNTDMSLPAEDKINYSNFVIKLNLFKSINSWESTISNFNNKFSTDFEFDNFSSIIIETFDNNLSFYSFISNILKNFLK
jgi:hypothetical protein